MRSITKIGSILIGLSLCGCVNFNSSRTDSSRWPDFPNTPRPSLSIVSKSELSPLSASTTQKLLDNDQALKNYAQRLESQIEVYRDLKKKNSK